jgi:hypothetical protein
MWGRIARGLALSLLAACSTDVGDEHALAETPAHPSGDLGGGDVTYGGSICDGAGTNVKINGVEFRMPVFCRDDYRNVGDPPPRNHANPALPAVLPAIQR